MIVIITTIIMIISSRPRIIIIVIVIIIISSRPRIIIIIVIIMIIGAAVEDVGRGAHLPTG